MKVQVSPRSDLGDESQKTEREIMGSQCHATLIVSETRYLEEH